METFTFLVVFHMMRVNVMGMDMMGWTLSKGQNFDLRLLLSFL